MNMAHVLRFIHQIGWHQTISGTVGLILVAVMAFPRAPRKGRERRWEMPGFMWWFDSKLRAALLKGKFGDGTFLGRANGWHNVVIPPQARASHMQIVGPTQSGKSQLLLSIAAQDMKKDMPVFFMEAKGDRSDFEQFLKAAELTGRLETVRYFNPQDPRSMTFNPIRPVPGQEPRSVAEMFARAIGKELGTSGEGKDYFDNIEFGKILNMAKIFCSTELEFTLRDCYWYFADAAARHKAFELCKNRRLVALAEQEFKEKPDTSGLTPLIRPWIDGQLGEILNSYRPQIKLEEIFEEGLAAYFAIPVASLQLLANPLGRMIITGLMGISSWRQEQMPKPPPASVFLDEFAQFVTPGFLNFVEQVASAKMWTILSHQDLNQLSRVKGADTGDFKSSVFTNTSGGCKVAFRTANPDDAEFWSRAVGTYRTYEDTEQIVKTAMGQRKTGGASRRWVEEFKIHPNRLKNLRTGTALVFSPSREDCLARTARLYPLLGAPVPRIPYAPAFGGEGLDLESAVPDPEAVQKQQEASQVQA